MSVEAVEVAWRERYAASVRVVDAPPAPTDRRRSDLESVDPDDLAFADAVALMGPILALSEDAHLTSRGLATGEWRDLPRLIEALRGVDMTLRLTPELTAVILSEAAKAARRHPRIAIALALLAFALTGPLGPKQTRLSRDRARAVAGGILRGLLYLLETHGSSSREIAARLVPGTVGGPVGAVVAALIRQSEPIPVEALVMRLMGKVEADVLPAILTSCPAFVETETGWQLGRRPTAAIPVRAS
ncbi:MAG TPA: hypothetical protein VG518_08710 [Solirubrobacterales bacterium]|nr:hypothetical protein [Solirubrobacterales bacterium]